jgi:hypothetical protein
MRNHHPTHHRLFIASRLSFPVQSHGNKNGTFAVALSDAEAERQGFHAKNVSVRTLPPQTPGTNIDIEAMCRELGSYSIWPK